MDTKINRKQKNVLGHEQSSYAGTNPDKYGDPRPAEEQDNPIQDQEAQNVREGKRITGKEAEHAKNKAKEGIRQKQK
jgi:hypothetical protein